MANLIPVLSLLIALLAVFVGPFVTLRSDKMKLDAERRRQWEVELRQKLAEFLGATVHYYAAGFEDREDAEYLHVTHLEYELELLLDPDVPEHAELSSSLQTIHHSLSSGREGEKDFVQSHKRASALAHRALGIVSVSSSGGK